jgi:hypothetical protein
MDYAIVSVFIHSDGNAHANFEERYTSGVNDAWRNHNVGENNRVVTRDRSPFRNAVPTFRDGTNVHDDDWQYSTPRDTMAWWEDGTSNVIIMAEKHIPTAGDHLHRTIYDATWIHGGDRTFMGTWRHFRRGIQFPDWTLNANDPGALLNLDTGGWGNTATEIGSWHPGICHLLFGDGSVQAAAVATRPRVLLELSHPNDGLSPALPL